MDTFDGILDVSCKELDQIVRSGKYRSREDVDTAYKLIDIVKDVYTIWAMEDGGYSGDDYTGSGSYRGSYNRGGSYASYPRGRGRYSSRSDGRRYGYSRHDKEEFADGLRELMDQAPDEQTRQSINRMLSQLDQEG